MAIGNEVNTPPFVGQRSCNNNGKNKTLASSGCGIIQFDRPVYFNSLPTPLSGEKGNPGQLAKRNVTTVQPSIRGELAQQSVSTLSCMFHCHPRFFAQPILHVSISS
jgi:hypothetical protein